MDAATRALVRERADNRCEYCLLRQEYCEFTHTSSTSFLSSMAGATRLITLR